MRKVAIVIPSLRGGGAEKVIANLVRHLDTRNYHIKLIVINKEGPNVKLLPSHIDVVDLESVRVRNSIPKLVKELNKFRPDTIFSTLGYLNLTLVAIKPLIKNNPKLVIRHAISPSISILKLPLYKRYIYKMIYSFLYPKANTIIAQGNDMKKEIINYYKVKPEQIFSIYNPVDLDYIKKMKDASPSPYYSNEINILAVGRLSYQKGFDNLIRAFKKINADNPNTFLTIIGTGKMEQELHDLTKRLSLTKHVAFEGYQENPYPYYKYADTYVLSSRYEGFPNTLLEALACGTKIVSTNCPTGPREILEDGKYGILTPVSDIDGLYESISKSLSDENRASNRAEYYNISKIVKEYESLL